MICTENNFLLEYLNSPDISLSTLISKISSQSLLSELKKINIKLDWYSQKFHSKISELFIHTPLTVLDISRITNTSNVTITKYLKNKGIQKLYGTVEGLSMSETEQFEDDYRNYKKSAYEISQELGIPYGRIKGHLKDKGLFREKQEVPEELLNKMKLEYETTFVSYSFLSRKYNVDLGWIEWNFKKLGITKKVVFITDELKEKILFDWKYTRLWCPHLEKKYGYNREFIRKRIVKDTKKEFATTEEKLEWKKYYEKDGLSVEQISKKVKQSYHVVKNSLNELGVLTTHKSLTPEQEVELTYKYHVLKITSPELAKQYNVHQSTIIEIVCRNGGEPNHARRTSSQENEIHNWLLSIGIQKVNKNDRDLLRTSNEVKSKEIDIYLPDHKLAIEFDGLYWHNENHKPKNYHIEKTLLCSEKGVQLIHIFEDEWIERKDIIKSMLLNKIGLSKKIFARKCVIKEVNKEEAKIFFNNNHLQGHATAMIVYGLYFNNALVSLMSFNKSRFNKKYKWELSRFCNILNTTVVGGASRLFKHFINNHPNESIISYSDLRYGSGGLYKELQFKKISTNKPSYFYIIGSTRVRREKFMKRKLEKLFPDVYEKSKSEHQIMREKAIYRIYDCGTIAWVYNQQKTTT